MRAAVVNPDGATEVGLVDEPAPGHGEILLRVTSCGICGSDLKSRPVMPHGTVMGHEFCGEVVAVGPGTDGEWREGMRAAVLPVLSCGTCKWCRTGNVAHCASARLIGLGGRPGGFAEFAVASQALSFRLPDGMPEPFGALVEPFSVGLHTARAARIEAGDRVAIIGAGPVGLATAGWADEMGAGEIVVSDPAPSRRRLGRAFGATAVVDPATDDLGGGYDVVVECVGKPGLLNVAVAAAGTKGRVVVAGVCSSPDPYVPVRALMKELTISFAVYYLPEEFEMVIRAFASGRIDPAPLVTSTVSLGEVDRAFGSLSSSAEECKILVDPRRSPGSGPAVG